MCARYIPSAEGTAEDPNAVPTGTSACDCAPLGRPPKVGEKQPELANGLSACLVLVAPTEGVYYKYANQEKLTAGV